MPVPSASPRTAVRRRASGREARVRARSIRLTKLVNRPSCSLTPTGSAATCSRVGCSGVVGSSSASTSCPDRRSGGAQRGEPVDCGEHVTPRRPRAAADDPATVGSRPSGSASIVTAEIGRALRDPRRVEQRRGARAAARRRPGRASSPRRRDLRARAHAAAAAGSSGSAWPGSGTPIRPSLRCSCAARRAGSTGRAGRTRRGRRAPPRRRRRRRRESRRSRDSRTRAPGRGC